MSAIELRRLAKRFGATPVLADVELEVPSGSLTAILGASGSGKTTLLRLIAGFERLDAGTIAVGGRTLDDGRRAVRSQDRAVGYVPQDGALFPHLTVLANVAFGLRRAQRAAAEQLLELVGLSDLRRRYPHQLSGGQQQRVALARALAIEPAVLLLDEPFGSLDASLRADLRRDVARILAETATTAVLVTHDQEEALSLADQIALLADGRIVACGAPRTLYEDPAGTLAASALGEINLLPARIRDGHAVCALGAIDIRASSSLNMDGAVQLMLRPEQLALSLDPQGGAAATVTEVEYYGHDTLVRLRPVDAATDTLVARVEGGLELERDQRVWVKAIGGGHIWPHATLVEDAAPSRSPDA